jgi:hypothetical protein
VGYRDAFGICALFVLAAVGISFLLKETRGANIYEQLRP